MPLLNVEIQLPVGKKYLLSPDFKHSVFGFCFRGPAISENSLQQTGIVKEAYGVLVNGVHYVCIVCFKRLGLRISAVNTLPYALGLLPCSIMAELIPGRNYHLTAYKVRDSTDDPVLEMIKRPSSDKWFWHYPTKEDM
jgi:hypothetical protein